MVTIKIMIWDIFVFLLGGCFSALLLYSGMVFYDDWSIWQEGVLIHAGYFALTAFCAYVCYRVFEHKPSGP